MLRWGDIGSLLVVGSLAYAGVVVILRASGKRSLAKFNAFDFVVTIALGSILATILVSQQVELVRGLAAFALLVGLQYLATLGIRRSRAVEKAAKGGPTVLLFDGVILEDQLSHMRVTEEEVASAVRSAGYGDPALIEAVVMETNGVLSVIPRRQRGDGSVLRGLEGHPE